MKPPLFPKLTRRIMVNTLFIPIVFLLVISSVTGVFMYRYMQTEYENTATDGVAIAMTNFDFSLGILSSDLRLLADDDHVNDYVVTGQNAAATQTKLSTTVASDPHLLGLSLYGLGQSIMLSSSNMSGLPNLNDLLELDGVADFTTDEDESLYVSLRHEAIASNYNYAAYDSSFGMLSLMIKITDSSDTWRGLLVADLDTTYVYDTYFDYGRYDSFPEVITFITGPSGFLRTPGNQSHAVLIAVAAPTETFVPVSPLYDLYRSEASFFGVATLFNRQTQRQKLAIVVSAILVVDIALATLAVFVAVRIAANIKKPLHLIIEKMEDPSF